MHFSIATVLCDMEMSATSTPLNLRGQGHVVILAKDHMAGIF